MQSYVEWAISTDIMFECLQIDAFEISTSLIDDVLKSLKASYLNILFKYNY